MPPKAIPQVTEQHAWLEILGISTETSPSGANGNPESSLRSQTPGTIDRVVHSQARTNARHRHPGAEHRFSMTSVNGPGLEQDRQSERLAKERRQGTDLLLGCQQRQTSVAISRIELNVSSSSETSKTLVKRRAHPKLGGQSIRLQYRIFWESGQYRQSRAQPAPPPWDLSCHCEIPVVGGPQPCSICSTRPCKEWNGICADTRTDLQACSCSLLKRRPNAGFHGLAIRLITTTSGEDDLRLLTRRGRVLQRKKSHAQAPSAGS